LLDRLLIAEVIFRYSLHYDEGELDSFEALFAQEAELDIDPPPAFMAVPLRGRGAIGAAMRARYAVVSQTATRRHVISNVVFDELSPEKARSRSFLTVLSANHGGGLELMGSGVYHDEFVKREGRWLFMTRRLKLDSLNTR
jgi:hypothetical protein